MRDCKVAFYLTEHTQIHGAGPPQSPNQKEGDPPRSILLNGVGVILDINIVFEFSGSREHSERLRKTSQLVEREQ